MLSTTLSIFAQQETVPYRLYPECQRKEMRKLAADVILC